MLRIGLTGGVATGKSHVRSQFADLGWPTIDADQVAREVVRQGEPAWHEIRGRFGGSICDESGAVDRPALARLVFSDERARRDLEAIVHPRVYGAIRKWLDRLARAGSHQAALADIPLLYETGHAADFDTVIVAICQPATQLQRLMARDGLDEAEARQRIATQWPTAEKAARADVVISTDGDLEDTSAQVADCVAALGRAR